MVTRHSIGTYGPMESVTATTSTGPGTEFPTVPFDTVAMSVLRASTAATGTEIQAQGSLDGVNWFALGATQTYTSTGVSVYVSTGSYLATTVRAAVLVHAATGTVTVSLTGR